MISRRDRQLTVRRKNNMYSDSLFDFSKITDELGLDEGKEILLELSENSSNYALDGGMSAEDIWQRSQRVQDCIDLIEDNNQKNKISNMIYFACGVMPDSDSVENRFEVVENLENVINDFKSSDDPFASHLIALGPGGIDHDWDSVEYSGRDHEYFDYSTVGDEKDLFALELTLAKKLNMPFILHSRKGFKETSDVLKAVKWNKGLVHGFSYSKSELEFFLDLGWYISFSGTVTYGGKKNFSDISDLIEYVPKDRILIETDSPFYPPVPVKSDINVPGNIKYIYEYISSRRNVTCRKLNEIVSSNFQNLFNL